MANIDYKASGVDIKAGNEAVKQISSLAKKTFNANVLSGLGSFGSLFNLKDIVKDYKEPIVVQSIDGVGTKSVVATKAGQFTNLGRDLFSAAVNDIVVMGAKPLTFLDYIAFDKLDTKIVKQLIEGLSDSCQANGVALIGGETAEMPNVYLSNEIDLVGIVTGIVERSKVIDGSNITEGDMVFNLHSNGLHTNGFSLARKILFEVNKYELKDKPKLLKGESVGEALLKPHLSYNNIIQDILKTETQIKGLAHITGGGIFDNIERILPVSLAANIYKGQWNNIPIFNLLNSLLDLDDFELFRTFNMGAGLIIIADPQEKQNLYTMVSHNHPHLKISSIGEIVKRQNNKAVQLHD